MTLEKLRKRQPYITDFHLDVTQEDVDIINKAIKKMYRKPMQLAAGDIVEFTTPYGDFSKRAIVERIDGDDVHICEHGSAWCSDDKNYLSISGGSFYTVPKSDLMFLGRDKRNFSEWGHWGACARGAVSVPVTVNVWRNKSDFKYTTEFYEKRYIYHHSKEYMEKQNTRYEYSSTMPTNAWVSNTELSAWCFLHKALIEKSKSSGDGYNTIVWTWKTREHYWCNDDEVLKMNGFHDYVCMNAYIRNVCYVYDEANKMIDVFYGKNELAHNVYPKYKNAIKIISESNIHFPESFIKE